MVVLLLYVSTYSRSMKEVKSGGEAGDEDAHLRAFSLEADIHATVGGDPGHWSYSRPHPLPRFLPRLARTQPLGIDDAEAVVSETVHLRLDQGGDEHKLG